MAVDLHSLLHGELSRNEEGFYSYSTASGDGVTVTFPFSFVGDGKAYIRESDIHIFVRDANPASPNYGEETEILDELLFPTDNTVTLTTIIPAPLDFNSNITIRRIMPKDTTFASTSTGAIFRKEVLNNSFLQSLYVVHEALDGFLSSGLLNKTLRVSDTDPVAESGLVIPTLRENLFLSFDSFGAVKLTEGITNINDITNMLIADLTQAYEFPTLSLAAASTIAFPIGKVLRLKERTIGNGGGADWEVIATGVTEDVDLPDTYSIVVSTGVPTRSLKLKVEGIPNILEFGALSLTDSTGAIQAAVDFTEDAVLIPKGFFSYTTLTSATSVRFIGEGYTVDMFGDNLSYGAAAWSDLSRFSGSVLISTALSGDSLYMGASSGTASEPLVNFQFSDLLLIGAGTGTATALHLVRSKATYFENFMIGNFFTGYNLDSCQSGAGNMPRTLGCSTPMIMGGTITSNQWVFTNFVNELYDIVGLNLIEAAGVQVLGGLFQDSLVAGAIGINIGASSSKAVIKGTWFENTGINSAIRVIGNLATIESCNFQNDDDNVEVLGADRTRLLFNNFSSAADLTIDSLATNTFIMDSFPSSFGAYTNASATTLALRTTNGRLEFVDGLAKQTKRPFVRAYLTAIQNLTSGVTQTVQFNATSVDQNNKFINGSFSYLPDIAGWYEVNVNLDLFAPAGLVSATVALERAGGLYTRLAKYTGTNAEEILTGSCRVHLNGSQALTITANVTGVAPTVQANPTLFSYLDITLVEPD